MKLGIVGSRRRNNPEDKELIKKRILLIGPEEIVSGGCPRGADRFAEQLARDLKIPITIYRPDCALSAGRWKFIEACYIRNEKVARRSDILLALVAPDRKGGTENTIKHFRRIHGGRNLEIL